MDNRSGIIFAAVLLVLAGGSWWLTQDLEEEPERRPRPPHTPDFWIEELSALTMDKQGQPRRRLNAAVMRHFPDDESTELEQPEIELLAPGKPPWLVRSEQGWVSADGDLVLLQGKVFIDREGDEEVRPVHLETRDLRVQPDDEYAETDNPVQIVSGSSRVESTGLQAWLREPMRIKLLADVRGHYENEP